LRRLYIAIFEATGRHQDARSQADSDFFERRAFARAVASARAAQATLAIDCAPTSRAHGKSRQESKIRYIENWIRRKSDTPGDGAARRRS
jgi:hypothetical protein